MRLSLIVMALAVPAFAQLDDNVLSVTAIRTINLQPDSASITLFLTTPVATGIDEAVAALQGSVAATDLTAVNTFSDGSGSYLSWVFTRSLALPQLGAQLAAVAATQNTLAQKKNGFSFSFSVQGQISQDAQQSAALCPVTSLVSDARAQAQTVADAAGVKVGPVVSLAQTPSIAPVVSQVPTFAFRTGQFLPDPITGGLADFLLGVISSAPPPVASRCSLTVEFKLVR